MNGLIIKSPHIEKILDGKKTWEIRGSNTNVRGEIALIKSGSGMIIGTCELVDVIGTLTLEELINNADKSCSDVQKLKVNGLYYKNTYAWVLQNAKYLEKPVPYKHPMGAVIWVKLDVDNQRLL